MTEYRFKSHTCGCGATPANWKGWAAAGSFVIGLIAASYLLLAWEPAGGIGPGGSRIAVWALAIPMLSVGFIALARSKTDGQWGWRWGK
jgi:hypothetical protein